MKWYQHIFKFANSIIIDTLQKDVDGERRFDRMKIMMCIAFNVAVWMAIADFCDKGLRLDVWFCLIGFAFGTKIIDAQANKIKTTL